MTPYTLPFHQGSTPLFLEPAFELAPLPEPAFEPTPTPLPNPSSLPKPSPEPTLAPLPESFSKLFPPATLLKPASELTPFFSPSLLPELTPASELFPTAPNPLPKPFEESSLPEFSLLCSFSQMMFLIIFNKPLSQF